MHCNMKKCNLAMIAGLCHRKTLHSICFQLKRATVHDMTAVSAQRQQSCGHECGISIIQGQ